MRTLKLIMLCCCLSIFGSSCQKNEKTPLSTDFSIEVTDITAINARLSIGATGDTPSLVRYMAPVSEAELKSNVNVDDAEALKSYISRKGTAIELPYSSVLLDLNPETTYMVGVIAIDEDMDVYAYKTATFTMKDLNSMFENTLGDPSNAGELKENILK